MKLNMKYLAIPLAFTVALAGCALDISLEEESPNDLEVSCREGDDYSCVRLGSEYQETHDYFSAAKYYVMACNDGNRDGCREAARLYFEGQYNLKQSLSESKKYAEKGCKLGDQISCGLVSSDSVIMKQRNSAKHLRK